MVYQLVAFDLDDTLAPSKGQLPPEVATALHSLLEAVPVCVISGGNFTQFETQLLDGLSLSEDLLGRLHLMPTCGTRYYRRRDGRWVPVYAHDLTAEQRERATSALERRARELDLWEEDTWGPVVEDRLSQITFSALGQQAPIEAKKAWDPSGEKKAALAALVATDLPDLEVRGGGSTSVDITQKGVDKAYGMAQLTDALDLEKEQIVFVGDRLDPGGNDYPVKAGGWPTIAVDGWEQTVTVIRSLLADSLPR